MTTRHRNGLCWLIGIGMTAALFAFVFLALDPKYAVNDDSGILRPFMGYETGEPAHFHIYIHGLLAWPLHWLGLAAPGVAWFSWMQLGFLFLASVVCQKSILQGFLRKNLPLWAGVLFALAFGFAFVLPYVARITFTQTAALLGAAAAAQILSIDGAASRGAVYRGMGLSLLLCVLAYSLRQITLLPILAFCALAMGYVALGRAGLGGKRSLRPLLAGACAFAVVLGCMAGLREWEIEENGAREYLRWQSATEELIDRYDIRDIPEEELARVGWSMNTATMVASQWFFLDESISTEAFDELTAYVHATRDESIGTLTREAMEVLAAFPEENRAFMPGIWLALALLVLAAAGAAGLPGGPRTLLMLAGIALLTGAMLFYLAFAKGRMPLRAALMALLPAAAMVFALLPEAFCARGGRIMMAVALVACVGLCAWQGALQIPSLLPDEEREAELGNPVEDLLEYALSDESMLIIHDNILAGDLRLFPDTSEGIPHNVSFWGGWGLRSGESIRQFANFGIDLLHFPPETFLRDDVLFAATVVDPPPKFMLNYLREKVDPNVDCMLYGENGFVYFFQFYIP